VLAPKTKERLEGGHRCPPAVQLKPSGQRLRARYWRQAASLAKSLLNSCNDRGYSGRIAPDAIPWDSWSQPDKQKLRSSDACAGFVCFIPLFGDIVF
jgi:hypothetical protein